MQLAGWDSHSQSPLQNGQLKFNSCQIRGKKRRWPLVTFPARASILDNSVQLRNARIPFCGQEEEGSKENHLLIKCIKLESGSSLEWSLPNPQPPPHAKMPLSAKVCVNCFKLPSLGGYWGRGPNQHPLRPARHNCPENTKSAAPGQNSLPRDVQSPSWTNRVAPLRIRSETLSLCYLFVLIYFTEHRPPCGKCLVSKWGSYYNDDTTGGGGGRGLWRKALAQEILNFKLEHFVSFTNSLN